MANALPILLLGGAAAIMLTSKKKKKLGVGSGGEIILPPTTPPPLSKTVKRSGSGYPGVSRDRMQEIQILLVANGYDVGSYGLDGKYGPATKGAVWEFQEDWGGLGVDGKPGPKTQAALEEAEAGRLQAQQVAVQQRPQKKPQIVDECDPLDPGTWGSGNVCVFDGVRWARKRAYTLKANPMEVAFTSDYSTFDVGSMWSIKVLDQWLDKERLYGRLLETKKYGSMEDYLWNNPSGFIAETFGATQKTGERIFVALGFIVTGGLGYAGGLASAAGSSLLYTITSSSAGAIGVSTVAGAPAMITKGFWDKHNKDIAASALDAFARFSKSHYVIVNGKKVRIDKLPADKQATWNLAKYIMNYIYKFQKGHFKG